MSKTPLFSVILLVSSLPLFAQTANTSDAVIAQENAFWKSYIEANTLNLSQILSSDFVNIEEQLMNRDQTLAFVRQFHEQCTLAPVKLTEPRVTFLSPDIATLVYRVTETPTCGAHTMSGETNVSTVWIRREGRWQMHIHTEHAVPSK